MAGGMSGDTLRYQSLGLELVARTWGPEDGPALVFLHGFVDTGSSFAAVAEPLAEAGYRVLSPDHRGQGDSGHLGPGGYYHFPDYVLDLDALWTAAGLERAVLAGHSMGASIAGYFAGTFPERLRGLIFLDGVGPPHVPDADSPTRMKRFITDVRKAETRQARGIDTLDEVADRIARMSPRASREVLLWLAERAARQGEDGRWYWRFDPLHRTRSPSAFDADRFRAFLSRVDAPCLAIWGAHTPFRPPDAGERLAALADVREVTLEDAGHNLHHEQPEALTRTILAFLADLDAPVSAAS